MIAITKGIHEYQRLRFNSRFSRVRRRRALLILSYCFWIVPTLSTMAVDDESTSAARHIYLPELSILEVIVTETAAGLFRDDDEEGQCRRMVVEALSEQEQTAAASASYAYWAWDKVKPPLDSGPDPKDKEEVRIRMAMREARRHFVGNNGNYAAAVERLKLTLQWREESKINLLRCCFAQSTAHSVAATRIPTTAIFLSDEDVKFCQRMERLIEHDLMKQTMAIRGLDKQNRPIILRFPRQRPWNDTSSQEEEDSFQWAQLYMAERAIAAAEIRSRSHSELLTVFFDFGSYDSKNAPPVSVMIRTVTVLQANYPERLGKALIMDVPFWINAVISVVQPFLSAKTREKLVVLGSSSLVPASLWRPFSSSDDSASTRDAALRELVDADQAMPRFRDDGHLKSDIDIAHFLRDIPFYELYDFGVSALSVAES